MIARHLLGEPDRRHRLEQREQRPAEQPGLLAGDNRDGCGVGQRLAGFDGTRRGAAEPLLRADDRRNFLAPPVVGLRAGDRLRPRGAIGGSPEKNGATAEKSYA